MKFFPLLNRQIQFELNPRYALGLRPADVLFFPKILRGHLSNEKRPPPTRAASLRQTYSESGKLRIERARYAIKRLVQSGAGGAHRNDDHNRNSSSDETILNGGHARVVFQET